MKTYAVCLIILLNGSMYDVKKHWFLTGFILILCVQKAPCLHAHTGIYQVEMIKRLQHNGLFSSLW